jgi:hypothetical protein
LSYGVLRDELDNDYEMSIRLELSAEEVSLLQMCVALVLGGVFQDKVEAGKISNIFKNKPGKLEALYSKLEHSREKKKPDKTTRSRRRLKSNLMEHIR